MEDAFLNYIGNLEAVKEMINWSVVQVYFLKGDNAFWGMAT